MYRSWSVPVLLLSVGFGLGALANNLVSAASSGPVKVENLLRAELQVAADLEVILSLVEIAPGTSLPKHHHPGEEFVYLIEGAATVWQKGKADTTLQAGDVFKVPLDQVHTAMTSSQAAKAIVFRVHRKGMPDRIAY